MAGQYHIGDTVLGNWTLVKPLGQGRFGRVYKACRVESGITHTAAIKVITIPYSRSGIISTRAEGMDDASARAHFEDMVKQIEREFERMYLLKGAAHVVSCEDHAVIPHEDDIGWDILIRMELLDPLLEYAYQHPFSRRDVIRLGIDICKALELCQKYNIVHRDIKPDNIFVTDSGGFKLGDFGIARTIERSEIGMGLSKKGTDNYMAPEVYGAGGKYGFSVDTYSLGIVLYRLLNQNRTPFLPDPPQPITSALRETALIRRMRGDPIPAPYFGEGRLGEIVLKACAYRPEHRYSSPMQMRQELESILYDADESQLIYPSGDYSAVKESRQTQGETVFEKAHQREKTNMGTQRPEKRTPTSRIRRARLADAASMEPKPKSASGARSKKPPAKKRIFPAIAAVVMVLGIVLWSIGSSGTVRTAWEAFRSSTWRDNVLRRSRGADDDLADFGGIERNQIKTVTFRDTLKGAPADSVDVSEEQNGSVLMWAGSNGKMYDLFIAGEGGVNGEAACTELFRECINLQSVDFNRSFHTGTTEDMHQMFFGCSSLKDLDLSGWDTSAVTDMSGMFSVCKSLKDLELSGWDTSAVIDMSEMFCRCESLTELNLAGWNTSAVKNMSSMFHACYSLEELDLTGWDTSSVTDMSYMFRLCSALTALDLSGWDTSSVADAAYMFYGCYRLTNLRLDGWDTTSMKDYVNFMEDDRTVNGRPWEELFREQTGWEEKTVPRQNVSAQWNGNMLRDSGTSVVLMAFGSFEREQIRTVTFLDTLANAPVDSVDVSEEQDGSVLLWGSPNGELYDLYIAGEGGVNGEVACNSLFRDCSNLLSVNFNRCFYTSTTSDMRWMFDNCGSLIDLDLSGWDTASVVNMESMFRGCSSLTELDLSGWDTSSVRDMGSTFCLCSSLAELNLSGWDTSSVEDMCSMFSNCGSLTELDLSGWNTSLVKDMRSMFGGCGSLAALNLTGWDTSSVEDMCSMFRGCGALPELDLSGWTVSPEIKHIYFMDYGSTIDGRPWEALFGEQPVQAMQATTKQTEPSQWRGNVLRSFGRDDDCEDFGGIDRDMIKTVIFLDTLEKAPPDSVDVSKKRDGSVWLWIEVNGDLYDLYIAGEGGVNGEVACNSLFRDCSKLLSVEFNHCFHTETTKDMNSMFKICWSLETPDLSELDTSSVTDMGEMFSGCCSLTRPDLSGWDTSSVRNMCMMFYCCESLTELDLSGLDTSSLENMSFMFSWCLSLTNLNLAGWDTSSVRNMNGAFEFCSLTNLDLAGWDTSSVTDMNGVFGHCGPLEELDLSGWDTSSVTDMDSLFSCCYSLINLNLSGWDTSSVTDMGAMFCNCQALTKLNLSGWDTSLVTDMGLMFRGCESLKELDLSGWDVSSVTDMNEMFSGCDALTEPNLAGWDVSNVETYRSFMDEGKTINGRPWKEYFEQDRRQRTQS